MKRIVAELKEHYPFTLFGALTGIILMMVFRHVSRETAHHLFYVFHPLHVFLSALVTAGLYCRYKSRKEISGFKIWKVITVGFIGAVGVGTLSDSIVPFWGETLLDMPHRHAHIGILEKPWLITFAAVAGIILAYFRPTTKHPHAGHVLISTWASLFHMLMASHHDHAVSYFGIFIFLFLAVWLPCCLSDIVFPLLFVKKRKPDNQVVYQGKDEE